MVRESSPEGRSETTGVGFVKQDVICVIIKMNVKVTGDRRWGPIDGHNMEVG